MVHKSRGLSNIISAQKQFREGEGIGVRMLGRLGSGNPSFESPFCHESLLDDHGPVTQSNLPYRVAMREK